MAAAGAMPAGMRQKAARSLPPFGRGIPRVAENAIQKRLVLARNGQDPRVIGRMESGWLVLADTQPLAGYCILMADPDVESLNAMPEAARLRYLSDTVRTGDALLRATGAERINYETWCNLAPSLHTHIVPRYANEAPKQRVLPMCVAYDVAAARPFDSVADAPLMHTLRKLLDITPAGV
jgi:diadenosine tetraphosphate (Ap4A) HIT family hydrolase